MKIAYLLDDTSLCGGVKVTIEHARMLAERGFSVTIISKGEQPAWTSLGNAIFLSLKEEFSKAEALLGSFDLVIATFYRQVLELHNTTVKLAHFSQGYEADYPFWKEKKEDIERAYRLPVPKITISKRAQTVIKENFCQTAYYVPQGIDRNLFFAQESSRGTNEIRKVLIVGTWENGLKNIPNAVKGFALAKKKLQDISLVRVSTTPLSEEEKTVYSAEEYYNSVPPADMPAIYRDCDLAIVASLEGEGFGLPALEAMACGLTVILTKIHSFLSLDDIKAYAYFVSPSAEDIAEAVIRLCRGPELTALLRKRAHEVAEKFSYEKTAEYLVAAVNTIAAKTKVKEEKDIYFLYIEKPHKNMSMEQRLLGDMSKDTFSGRLPAAITLTDNPAGVTVGEILSGSDAPLIAVAADDTMYFSKNWTTPLIEALEAGWDIATPVCSDTFETDRPYYTPLTFNDAADHMRQKYRGQYKESPLTTTWTFVASRTSLETLPPDTTVAELPCSLKSTLVPSSVVHRSGDYYSSQREDILPFLPYGIKKVLDVGCARGRLGELIKKKYDCEVYGIELNEELAAEAQLKLDAVFCVDIEKAELPFKQNLDAIIFADILEHLVDPWAALKNSHKWLKPDGLVIASIPNTSHYSVITDLLRGQWDYIPFGLLCITHLRFFTKTTIEDMFLKSGFSVLTIKNQGYPVAIKNQIINKLSELINIEHINEEIFHPGYYIVAQQKNI